MKFLKYSTLCLSLLSIYVFNVNAQPIQKLLLIGIDGVRPDALVAANTPNLDGLITNATYSLDALNGGITISGPGWSNLLTGVRHEKHGVTDNSFSGENYAAYPHFFQRIEAYDANLNTASICNWGPINDHIVGDLADFKINVGSDAEVANQAANYLNTNEPDALFLHFDEVDHAGHSSGFSPDVPAYISTIESVDAHLGTVLTALNNRPNLTNENWMILVTTDHGGINFSHGGSSFEEQNIFIIASGDDIPNQEITRATLPPPTNCLNNSGEELYFDGNGDYVSVNNSGLFDFGTDQDFTVECRVRTDNPADVSIVGNKDWDSGGNPGFVLSFKFSSGPEWKVNIGDGSNRIDINTGGEIADNEWHTLSVTFDRDGNMSMYEDGVFLTEADISEIGNINTNFDLRFGADGLGAYEYKGAIAEVRVWDKVLEASTINDWQCTEIDNTHPDESHLIGYWKMKENEGGSTVSDFSANNNHGQIVNATWQTPVSYDYSNTPRQVDVAVTALTHLCVPIEAAWNLDGMSLVSECTPLSINTFAQPLNLTAVLKGKDVALDWTYVRSHRNISFEIERSSDGFSFEKVATLAVQSTDSYTFLDKKVAALPLFYRLKLVDEWGAYMYSNIVEVTDTEENIVDIFPNPVSDKLFLATKKPLGTMQLELYNSHGIIVHKTLIPDFNTTSKNIDMAQLPTGTYWLRLWGKEMSIYRKIIKN